MARFKLPTVKSWCEPWIASRMELENVIRSGAMPTCFIFVITGSLRTDAGEERFRYCRNSQCSRTTKESDLREPGAEPKANFRRISMLWLRLTAKTVTEGRPTTDSLDSFNCTLDFPQVPETKQVQRSAGHLGGLAQLTPGPAKYLVTPSWSLGRICWLTPRALDE